MKTVYILTAAALLGAAWQPQAGAAERAATLPGTEPSALTDTTHGEMPEIIIRPAKVAEDCPADIWGQVRIGFFNIRLTTAASGPDAKRLTMPLDIPDESSPPARPHADASAQPPALVGKLGSMSREEMRHICPLVDSTIVLTSSGCLLGDSHAAIVTDEGSGAFIKRVLLYRKQADGTWEEQMEGFWRHEPVVDGRSGVFEDELVLEGNALSLRDEKRNTLYVLLRLAPGESWSLSLDATPSEYDDWCVAHWEDAPGPIRAELATPAANKVSVSFTAADDAAAHAAASADWPDNVENFTLYRTYWECARPLLEKGGECTPEEMSEAREEATRNVSVEIQLVKPAPAHP